LTKLQRVQRWELFFETQCIYNITLHLQCSVMTRLYSNVHLQLYNLWKSSSSSSTRTHYTGAVRMSASVALNTG